MMQSKSFHIFSVGIEEEVNLIVDSLKAIPGVRSITGDNKTKIFAIQWSEPADWADIEKAILKLDYTPEVK